MWNEKKENEKKFGNGYAYVTCNMDLHCVCFMYLLKVLKNISLKSQEMKWAFAFPTKNLESRNCASDTLRNTQPAAAVPKIKTFCQSDNGQLGQMNTVHQKSKKPFSFTNYDCLWGLTTSRVLSQLQTFLSLPVNTTF